LTSITISETFRYGSPDTESIGDCALTEANDYIVLVFNTRHYINRRNSYGSLTGVQPIDYQYTYPNLIAADRTDPYDDDLAPDDCSYDWTWFTRTCKVKFGLNTKGPAFATTNMMWNSYAAVTTYCETNMRNQIMSYVEDYDDNIYSWSTCDFYYYDYRLTDCSIADIR